MGRKLVDAEILADYIAENDMEFQYAIEHQDRKELESLIEKIPDYPCAECIEAGGCPIREDCPNEGKKKSKSYMIVEQLEKEFKKYYGENWNKAPYLIRAIEIVKGEYATEQSCEWKLEDLEWNRAMDEAITIVKGGGIDGN